MVCRQAASPESAEVVQHARCTRLVVTLDDDDDDDVGKAVSAPATLEADDSARRAAIGCAPRSARPDSAVDAAQESRLRQQRQRRRGCLSSLLVKRALLGRRVARRETSLRIQLTLLEPHSCTLRVLRCVGGGDSDGDNNGSGSADVGPGANAEFRDAVGDSFLVDVETYVVYIEPRSLLPAANRSSPRLAALTKLMAVHDPSIARLCRQVAADVGLAPHEWSSLPSQSGSTSPAERLPSSPPLSSLLSPCSSNMSSSPSSSSSSSLALSSSASSTPLPATPYSHLPRSVPPVVTLVRCASSAQYIRDALALAAPPGTLLLYVSATDLWTEARDGDIAPALRRILRTARAARPCIVVLDDADVLVLKYPECGVAGALHRVLDDVRDGSAGDTVASGVGAVDDDTDGVGVVLACPGDVTARHAVLDELVYASVVLAPPFASLGAATRAWRDVPECARAIRPPSAVIDERWHFLSLADLLHGNARARGRPAAMQGAHDTDNNSNVSRTAAADHEDHSIAGGRAYVPGDAERRVRLLIECLAPHFDAVRRSALGAPVAALLHGPPGGGKTMLVRRMRHHFRHVQFVAVNATDLARGVVGASERRLRRLFHDALRQRQPVVLFFDEVDALFPRRAADGAALRRLGVTMLEQLDALRRACRTGGRVLVLCATNRPWRLDRSLTGAGGKLDELIYMGLPDADARRAALRQCARVQSLLPEDIVQRTQRFSFADIAGIERRAELEAVMARARPDAGADASGIGGANERDVAADAARGIAGKRRRTDVPHISVDNVTHALARMQPSVDAAELTAYEEWHAAAAPGEVSRGIDMASASAATTG